jgi:predicted ATPase
LIIATYRDDERPSLPEELPQMEVIKLERFADESITELSVSMLGSGGDRPQLIQLLERETEGNVFFIVEVLRELAQAAGNLAEISQMTLPKSVFAGGVQNILQRRLARVPEDYRPLLNLAALAGRELDLTILKGMAAGLEPGEFNLDDWLESCASIAVLEVKNNVWRFAHDKLRESVQGSIETADLSHHHFQVAEATEKAYPNQPEKATSLAYHWAEGGNKHKAAHYFQVAGKFALQNGAYHEAISLLKQSLALHQELESPAETLANITQALSLASRDSGQQDAQKDTAGRRRYHAARGLALELHEPLAT